MSAEHRFAIGAGILVFRCSRLPSDSCWTGCSYSQVEGIAKREDRAKQSRGQAKRIANRKERAKQNRSRAKRIPKTKRIVADGNGGRSEPFSWDSCSCTSFSSPRSETIAFAGGAVVLVVPAALAVLPRVDVEPHGFHEQLAVFLSVLVAAGAGAILAEAFRSPSFDQAAITIRDQEAPITGGYITSTEHSVVLTTRCEVVEAVPRDRIERISVGPDEVRPTHC